MNDGPEHHRNRSDFVRSLIQRPIQATIEARYKHAPPKTIVQYWHDLAALPEDVEGCITSWRRWEANGFTHRLFDENSATTFISGSLDARHARAFKLCYHPAMQADYFRLCYLFIEGGLYVDADDVCVGGRIDELLADGRLKVRPLCYDPASQTMVNQTDFLDVGADHPNWIFYFNNNPLIASRGHPVIARALQLATDLLEQCCESELPEIQSTAGPGNLSKTIFELGASLGNGEIGLEVLRDWDSFAVSKWPLSYRSDSRNWRLSNQQRFQRSDK